MHATLWASAATPYPPSDPAPQLMRRLHCFVVGVAGALAGLLLDSFFGQFLVPCVGSLLFAQMWLASWFLHADPPKQKYL